MAVPFACTISSTIASSRSISPTCGGVPPFPPTVPACGTSSCRIAMPRSTAACAIVRCSTSATASASSWAVRATRWSWSGRTTISPRSRRWAPRGPRTSTDSRSRAPRPAAADRRSIMAVETETTRKSGPHGERILLENHDVRVWSGTLDPGQRQPWHQHLLPYLIVPLTEGKNEMTFDDGRVRETHEKPGEVIWREPGIPHELLNCSDWQYRNVLVEIKSHVS